MIKRTRLIFFGVTAGIAAFMIVAFCGTILASTYLRDETESKRMLARIVSLYETAIDRPPLGGEYIPDEAVISELRQQANDFRTFVVYLDDSKNVLNYSHSDYFEREEVEDYLNTILESDSLDGFIVQQRQTQNGLIIAAMDMSIEVQSFNRLLIMVLLVGGSGIIVLLILIWFLSYWMVKPAERSLENQKRFVSEASHELKTPLTIISAGVELLQKQKGNNAVSKKWLEDIQLQTEKMTAMTTDLLAFSKIEEQGKRVQDNYDISSVVLNTVLEFEGLAFEQGKELVFDVPLSLSHKGDAKAVTQSVKILCDNAIKYSDGKDEINVKLSKQGAKVCLTVSNTCTNIPESEVPFLFERFYRGSEARAQTLGTGLGLSILKAIAEQNDWRLEVKSNSGIIAFTITF